MEKTATCQTCGKVFNKKTRNQKYCSQECYLEKEKRVAREKYQKYAKKEVDKQCVVCGKTFKTKLSRKIYCSDKCAIEGKKQKDKIRHAEKTDIKRKGSSRECDYCGKTFILSKAGQKYCSKECRRKVKSMEERERRDIIKTRKAMNMQKKKENRITTSIDDIVIKAEKKHMTYGQIVAQERMKKAGMRVR